MGSPFILPRPGGVTPLTAPPGFPPDVAPNQIIYASHINAIRDSVAVWPGNVDGNGKNLSGVAQITATGDIAAGSITTAGAVIAGAVSSALVRSSGADMVFAVGAGYPERMRITTAGAVGIGTASPALIGGAVNPASVVAQVLGAMAIGGAGLAVNQDGLLQLAKYTFLSGNNWSGWGLMATNLVVQSIGSTDTFYTPLTSTGGYKGLRMHAGIIDFIGGAGPTTGGVGVTPTVYMRIDGTNIQLHLGGSLKTLSVDGSGFVKAT